MTEEEFSKEYIEPAARGLFQAVICGQTLDSNCLVVLNDCWPEWKFYYGLERDGKQDFLEGL